MGLLTVEFKVNFAEESHATNDVLERYAMGRSTGPELAGLEEHLLVCESCQDRLAIEDSIRQRVRDGAAVRPQPRAVIWRPFPKLAWAAGLLAAGLALFAGIEWQAASRPTAPPAVILLQATRGAEDAGPAAPADRPLTVWLDLTGLPQFSIYKLEVVRGAGHPVLEADRAPQGNKLQASLSRGLRAGNYFVRVYSPARELLREYALVVRG
jgi:hypothetical protein